ncbi:MAG: PhnD/SsuA/transferrin family substrate-binding protein [Betaproteobacteria bacterium]|jgi:ABC-type phosphate/phosphonate transport system substrate-binding protein|nr:PhnD/SsuA/transferrin family substrate-binding protein [Betaproteobacteria bacterium]
MKLRILLAGFLSLALFAWRPVAAQERAYLLGVISYGDSAQMIASEYEGLTSYLSRMLKRPVRVEGARNFDSFAQRAEKKRYHMMFVAPSAVLDANKSAGYLPVAKIPGLLSVSFMAPGRTNIAFPEDMKGKRIGFTGKDAMITKLAFAELTVLGIKEPEKYFSSIAYYNDVDGVLAGMQMNLIDIGVANSGLFNVWTNKGENMNLIHAGKGVPHLTFAVRGDLPESVRRAITEALLKAHQDKEAQEFLRFSNFPGFEPAKLADFDGLAKTLGIK